MNQFCTITTFSHLYKVYALAESLNKVQPASLLHVLVVDDDSNLSFPNCRFWKLSDLGQSGNSKEIILKYRKNLNKLRWALKSVFMKHLLQLPDVQKLLYLDNDLYFYSDNSFLFDLLEEHAFILTPHYYPCDPSKNQNWLEANFRVGLFNAGFLGANKKAVSTLDWWAACCAYRCEKNSFRGLFDDQKYLDLVPVLEETSLILRHKGCNVAGWNIAQCPRVLKDGKLFINGSYPLVFIHYNELTIRKILEGEDNLLAPLYNEYEEALKRHRPALNRSELLKPQPASDKIKYSIWKFITDLGM